MIDAAAIADRILSEWSGFDRRSRFRHSPIRSAMGLLPAIARRAGVRFPAAPALAFGGRFHGVFPETVTAQVWRFGLYDARATAFVLRHLKEGQTFVDVGAHFGYFTLLASQIVGPSGYVIAIEPMPDAFAMLRKNVEANGLRNVHALNVAAADREETLTFRDFGVVFSALNTSANVRGTLTQGAAHKTVSVQSVPLDNVVTRPVRMLKIDTESTELQVLMGAQRTLERDKPLVMLECGGSADEAERGRVREIFAFMEARGYGGHLSDGRNLQAITADAFPERRYDVVFRHRFA